MVRWPVPPDPPAVPLRLLGLLLLTGCVSGPLVPVQDLDPRPDAVLQRAGGLGLADSVRYVIHVSADGLRPDAVERLGSALPAFTRLRTEGAWTHDARTDVDYRNTLPNHTAQLTGRPVLGPDGHGWTGNRDPAPGETLHSNRGTYVASVFDAAHDAGLQTAAYVSKSKFSLFDDSYGPAHGARDTTGADDGRDKIDRFLFDSDTERLTAALAEDLARDPAAYTFVHLRDPDAAGHWHRWSMRRGSRYLRAVQAVDSRLGVILDVVESDPRLRGRTVLVVTADHGGSGRTHIRDREENYTVPFYVWGPGIGTADLYDLNPERQDPGDAQVPFDAVRQPVRNGDAANLSLALLGLGPVPGSTIGVVPPRVRPDSALTSR